MSYYSGALYNGRVVGHGKFKLLLLTSLLQLAAIALCFSKVRENAGMLFLVCAISLGVALWERRIVRAMWTNREETP
jgi:hypothetical protein